jgi:hypothetical protein
MHEILDIACITRLAGDELLGGESTVRDEDAQALQRLSQEVARALLDALEE